jgi:hypothetical protein
MMPSFLGKLFGGGASQALANDEALQEPELSFARGKEEIQLKTELARRQWGLGEGGNWSADLQAGTITFTNGEGWIITAPVQVIGTLNTADGSWLWGWDHPSVPDPIGEHARIVRAFGEHHGLDSLTTRMIDASEEDGWSWTALAVHLAGAQGGYRGPAGDALVYMTYGAVTIRKGD